MAGAYLLIDFSYHHFICFSRGKRLRAQNDMAQKMGIIDK